MWRGFLYKPRWMTNEPRSDDDVGGLCRSRIVNQFEIRQNGCMMLSVNQSDGWSASSIPMRAKSILYMQSDQMWKHGHAGSMWAGVSCLLIVPGINVLSEYHSQASGRAHCRRMLSSPLAHNHARGYERRIPDEPGRQTDSSHMEPRSLQAGRCQIISMRRVRTVSVRVQLADVFSRRFGDACSGLAVAAVDCSNCPPSVEGNAGQVRTTQRRSM